MTHIPAHTREPTVTLRSASGQGFLSLEPVAAAAALTAALAIAPRLTALAAVGALMARMSITVDGRSNRVATVDQPVVRAS
jgi:hypothetical protein